MQGDRYGRQPDRKEDHALQYMIAYGALIAWPVVALALYLSLPAGRATIWTLLGGYLLLPVITNFDFPGIPPLDKTTIPSLAALILAPLFARHGEFRWPKSRTVNLLMLVYVLVPFATGFTNGEPITIGATTLPSIGFRESLSASIGNMLEIVPFLLGASLLGSERGHRQLLIAFVTAALFYSLPILAEIRLSPILQGWVYGVGQAEMFLQQIRSGGFRSMVFLGHGLLVSTFCAMAVIGAIGLWRMRLNLFAIPASLIAVYLAIILLLNKSAGSVLIVLVLAPLLIFLRSRQFLGVAFALAVLIVSYPAVRGANIMPLTSIVQIIGMVSPERAHSLDFRLRNEEMLLNRAERKPLFGWGSYGRNRVIVTTAWGTTADVSVTDGSWIIVIGTAGWIGYIACFGLLAYPFWRGFRLRRVGLPLASITLLAMHLLNLLDLIPNSSLRPITWLLAGSLVGMTVASLGVVPGRRTAPRRSPFAPREPATLT
jgi:hypothetical protein